MKPFSDVVSKHTKKMSFFEEEKSKLLTTQLNRLFGREKPVYNLLGGGKSADVLLWRNKKVSASALTGSTLIWVLLEWLNYSFLTLMVSALVMAMLVQFVWKNASVILKRSPSNVPRIVLPEKVFVNVSKTIGSELNHGLRFLQDVACKGNIKQFTLVICSLWAAAIIGSWCNFLTVLYIGFAAAHTLPVLYERYENQVDGFVCNVIEELQYSYRKLDTGILSRLPKGKIGMKKF